MDGFRHHGRPVYVRPTPETYAYQNLYGTVRSNPNGKVRPRLDMDSEPPGGKSKKFNFLPWKKNKSKADDLVPTGTLAKHNKYKFGSVSALSSASLYRDWDYAPSYTPVYSSSDLKHASVKSVNAKSRGLVTTPWETYKGNNNNDVEIKNFKNSRLNSGSMQDLVLASRTKDVSLNPAPAPMCKCQKKKSGPFGTLNFNSLKPSKCNCGFSSMRSTRGFAPPPPPRRRSILPDKVDLYAVHEDQVQLEPNAVGNHSKHENIYDTLSRHGKYRAPAPPTNTAINYSSKRASPQAKLNKSIEKIKKDPYSSVASRKSILECDVTAYDLVKNYLKSDETAGVDSDIDDDLCDNIIEKRDKNNGISKNLKPSQKSDNEVDTSYKSVLSKSPSPVSSESESGIYSQNSSIRIGGHGMKVINPSEGNSSPQTPSLYSEGSKTNSVDSRTSSWSTSSLSDDGIYSLPEPDYDDEGTLHDRDSVLRIEDRAYSRASSASPSLRKYPSGGYLDRKDASSRNSSMIEDYDSPRFSTIRKATSMLSLPSGSGGTLRARINPPSIPEVPISAPPPPPPPPPPNFSMKQMTLPSKESHSSATDIVKKRTVTKQSPSSSFSSSIASELSEKLKSNQPILKKNEVNPKQPMVVNSHNPYAEVKSILKKTGERLNPSSTGCGAADSDANISSKPVLSGLQKKRVQFKSLSNESLAVEQIREKALSSSDEEWEEARETFSNDSSPNHQRATNDSDLRGKSNDGFQTVEEFLQSKQEESFTGDKTEQKAGKGDKTDSKNSSKVPTIPRPSQPPPPPPNIRRGVSKGPPPPRPLSSAPKSFSHCDLRVTASARNNPKDQGRLPGLVKITSRPGQQVPILSNGTSARPKRVPIPPSRSSTDTFGSVKTESASSSTLPKNGVSSPAASLEATTSPRGKSDLGDQPPVQNLLYSEPDSINITVNNPHEENSLSRKDGAPLVTERNCRVSPNDAAEYEKFYKSSPKFKKDSFDETIAEVTDSNIYDSVQDDDSSDSSYMSLPSDKDISGAAIYDRTESPRKLSEKSIDAQDAEISPHPESDPMIVPKTVTCNFTHKDRKGKDGCQSRSAPKHESLTGGVEIVQESSIGSGNTERKTLHWLSSDEEPPPPTEIEGPLYSNLLYVPRKSPSPPPLPATLPPLPPKKKLLGKIVQISTAVSLPYTSSEFDEDILYDVLPVHTTPKSVYGDAQSIYESRRYSDTGATVVTIPSGASDVASEHIYCSVGSDGIYEELSNNNECREIIVSTNPFGSHRRSFFEGASKAEILRFLEGAKQRVVDHLAEDEVLDEEDDDIPHTKNARNNPIRISNISSSSDSSTISSNSSVSRGDSSSDELSHLKIERHPGNSDVERADSGVGSETSKPSVCRRAKPDVEELCADCDQQLEGDVGDQLTCCPLVCKKCDKKRSERKEIVTEIVETEFKYGKDLMIIKEEFKAPMEVAGLLTKEQLQGVFLNLDELIVVNEHFSEKLKDATDIAVEQGDEDYTTLNIGKLFLETTTMLKAFEVYCIRQGSASVLLTNLEKEKELLRIFLRVSQMENTLLRRMNLSAFLMVPVQRVTKYPLLLNRLYKVTPYHHKDREALREAQLKIELHLEHINQQTKGISGTKIWRRISNISAAHRRSSNISDIGSIQLRKMAMEVLEWSKEDIRFVMAGKLSFSGAVDFTKSRRGRTIKFTPSHALLATRGRPNSHYRPDLINDTPLFPRDSGIEDATLLLVKEKNGRYSLARDPLHLGSCIISAELEDEDIIEIQEYTTKESVFLKAECHSDTLEWLKQLRYHAKDLGTWKRRRNALANIMINGMIRQH